MSICLPVPEPRIHVSPRLGGPAQGHSRRLRVYLAALARQARHGTAEATSFRLRIGHPERPVLLALQRGRGSLLLASAEATGGRVAGSVLAQSRGGESGPIPPAHGSPDDGGAAPEGRAGRDARNACNAR